MPSIIFKFRSAVNFDSMEVGDRASISVGELRAKILRGKASQQGFDLVFSDAVSGLEYKGDDFQIPRGSSVIVRRVPCGAVPAALLDCQNLATNNLSEALLRGCNQNGNEINILLEARVEEQRKRNNNLPLELRCTLCKYHLKDAVMIRCCHHSFCENCISRVLIEKGRCPKCFSGQCSAEDLLPNLSLRKAIRCSLNIRCLSLV